MGFNRYYAIVGLIAASVFSCVTAAQVVGETQRIATQPSGEVRDATGNTALRVTVWYPAKSDSIVEPVVIGPPQDPLFVVGSVSFNAPIMTSSDSSGRRPVILLSHGFGGTARMMGWFATAMAKEGFIVISVDHPGNNGGDEMTIEGGILWWERAVDLRLAFERIQRDEVLGPHIDPERVGVAGFSAGGFTALLLGGAQVDRAHFAEFCQKNPGDGVCRPQVEFSITEPDMQNVVQDPRVADYFAQSQNDYSIPSAKAVFVMAPALVQATSPKSLKAISIPVSIIAGEADAVAPAETNALVAAKLVPESDITMLPDAGHYVFLSVCTPNGKKLVPVCAQTGEQSYAHSMAISQARKLFTKRLAKP
ncbi:dienelactone hydrolase [Arenicella chitinivorans]|uniref:Dienelactone hydrolase n=1 Tax=Arenicella chitinivorans TaxID=1329800 RepID=A0A918RYB0_9GAMM|nr:alpha/beta fold hydrolase [Arenicella chitinivorans]GHA13890.1 dienelactone hydrolase [Arenicella chitinivorans]